MQFKRVISLIRGMFYLIKSNSFWLGRVFSKNKADVLIHVSYLFLLIAILVSNLWTNFEVLSYDEMSESGTTLTGYRSGAMKGFTVHYGQLYSRGSSVIHVYISWSQRHSSRLKIWMPLPNFQPCRVLLRLNYIYAQTSPSWHPAI